MNPDIHFLNHALGMGGSGLGRTWPNPSVGCVLVKDGAVIATATTADGGRPHAEALALKAAGKMARDATAYVSLEPCAHTGQTPPCAEALIAAGVGRVVIAAQDADPRVSGKGIQILRAAGIEVVEESLPEAAQQHRGFFRRVRHGMPLVSAKLATSADGFMAHAGGQPRWVTGEESRRHVHGVRRQVDAVLTGIGTVLADNPLLTCRLPGAENPRLARVIADRNLRLPLDTDVVKTAHSQPTWVITGTRAVELAASHATELREAGVVLVAVEDESLAPFTILRALGQAGINHVLLEAGPLLSAAFLDAQCIDRLYWYRAPVMLGSAGASPMGALDMRPLSTTSLAFGTDRCDIYELASCLPD